MAYLISGLVGLLIVLHKPGRPAQVNRKTFGFPKELSEYEKQLETVILHLRKRSIVVICTLPYFVWLLYIIYNKDFPNRSNFEMLFALSFLSFLTILILASTVQYFQIWWSIGKYKK